jgi:hypothetical protein
MASDKTARKQPLQDAKALAAPYEPKPQEQAVIDELLEHRRSRPPSARIKVEQKRGTTQIGVDHPDPRTGSALLMKAIGTTSNDFLAPFVGQLASAGSKGTVDEEGTNFMLAVVKAIEPKDEIEAMLAAQMAAVHMATRNGTITAPLLRRRARIRHGRRARREAHRRAGGSTVPCETNKPARLADSSSP